MDFNYKVKGLSMFTYAVFAHNEAEHIIDCLHSIRQQDTSGKIYVLINGCVDNTLDVVKQYAKQDNLVIPVYIAYGDKANAWNVFIYDHARLDEADLFVFVDGDCQLSKDSILHLKQAYMEHPDVNGFAGLPEDVGRTTKQQAIDLLEKCGLAGNLYALTPTFIRRIRQAHIRIPTNTIGEDGFVGFLAYTDLDPNRPWEKRHIKAVEQFRFTYEPLKPYVFADLKLYYNRLKRYSLRQLQNRMLDAFLKEREFSALPYHIEELYALYPHLLKSQPNATWLDRYFDQHAIKKIKSASDFFSHKKK